MFPRARKGFTLVELLVVIVILGVAAAVVTPALRRPAASRTSDDLLSAYRTARRQAAARGVVVTLQLDLSSGAYLLLTRRAPELAPDTLEGGALRVAPGASLQGGWNGRVVAVFDPLGGAHADPVLIHSDEHTYEVAIDPWTAVAGRRRL